MVTGTTISSTVANNLNTDLATGLSTAICKDGQTTITGNLPMAGFKHTGVAVAANLTDYARADQTQNCGMTTLASVAGTNTVTGSASPTPSAYSSGQEFSFIPAATNTGATTLNVNSLGAKNIFANGAACVGGELISSVPVVVKYDGTQFNLIGNGASANIKLVQNGAYKLVASVAGTNTITGTVTPTPAYVSGQTFIFIPAVTNTGATTINLNSLGAKNIFAYGAACLGGELVAGRPAMIEYDGTQYNLLNPQPITATTASTFTFNGTGSPGTTGSVNLIMQRVGNRVAMNVPAATATTGTTSTLMASNTAVGTAFRPSAAAQGACVPSMVNNAANLLTPGLIQISTAGILTVSRDAAFTAFTNTQTAGIGTPGFDFVYYVG